MFKKLFESLRSMYRTPEIRDKVVFSLFILVVFRVLTSVLVVGVPADAMAKLMDQLGGVGDTISTVSGGVLATASVIAIGLGPYINASIILQLLGSVIPKLEELRKDGSNGRRIISMYTRYLTVPLALMQSFMIYSTLRGFVDPETGLSLIGELGGLELATMISILTGGGVLMMWLGELVTDKGVSNGSSYLIFLGIVSGLPSIVANNLRTADTLEALWFAFVLIVITSITIYLTQGERRIKIMYSRRVRAMGGQDSYVPIKLTQFGVLPVIFATSLMSFPQLMASFVSTRNFSETATNFANQMLLFLSDVNYNNLITFTLVVLFSFFYITVVFNTQEIAENLQRQGAFIPGIRPGKMTASYLRAVSFRLTAVGSVFLGILAILPSILLQTGILSATIMSGTGLLIVVGVVLEMKRQVESMIVVRSYDKYL